MDMALPDQLSHLVDDRVRRLAAYWLSRRGGRIVPRRADIDPADFPWALKFAWLCDYLPERQDFRYRLAGEAINDAYPSRLKGRLFSEVIHAEKYPSVRNRYLRIVNEPAIAHAVGAIYDNIRLRRSVVGERIVLPLSRDGGEVDMILGMTIFDLDGRWPHGLSPNPKVAITLTPVADLGTAGR